jgi:hypothetical protein
MTRWRNCYSQGEIDRYLQGVIDLHQRIGREGYRARPSGAPGREITVRVGRDGRFTKCGQGTHRLAITRLLGVPAVPVVVDLMHWDWVVACQQQRRTATLRQAVEEELADIARAHERPPQPLAASR